jgi:hypothetical protein
MKAQSLGATRGSMFARPVALGALLALFLSMACGWSVRAQTDPLPSWNDGAAKKAITDFVVRVIKEGGSEFVPPADRIAVFDNDGTLWCEQPVYFQLAFAFDHIKAMAPQHPEWKATRPFKAVLEKDMKALAASGEKGLLQIMATTHAGMTTEQFSKAVLEWTATSRHPASGLPARQWLQDICRLRRWRRVHAAVDGKDIRHSARTGGRPRRA